MSPVNFNKFSRNAAQESNYRLLAEPMQLKIRTEHFLSADEIRMDDDGCPNHPDLVVEETVAEYSKRMMRIRGARKQRAARAYRPIESMKVVKVSKPAPAEVVGVRLNGGSPQDERVAELEAKIRELLAIVRK